MTVFGRDTLITCLQTLIFGPELARTALRALASAPVAEADDPSLDAEPGKIVHEVRTGKAAVNWFSRYYGTVDATPLYLVLLAEVWRWTDDAALANELKEPALAALAWIDEWGDRDGDGFVEFERRSEHGLEVQSWKDSWDSQRFHDGTIATGPIAACEVQGYVYDAKRGLAEVARVGVARPRRSPSGSSARRPSSPRGSTRRSGSRSAAASTRSRSTARSGRVDSLTSNIGHLLWSPGSCRPSASRRSSTS